MYDYILNYHQEDVINIMMKPTLDQHYSINISFDQLFENDQELANKILKEPEETLKALNESTIHVQETILQQNNGNLSVKKFVHIRIHALPACSELHHRLLFPKNQDLGMFLQVSGTIARMTSTKMLEYQRKYRCVKCKHIMTIYADYDQYNVIIPPKRCTNSDACKSNTLIPVSSLGSDTCRDYQEIKLQEQVAKLGVGAIPNAMWVTLDNDLVDTCQPGDNVTICGIVKRRWKPLCIGKKLDVEIVLQANHLQVTNDLNSPSSVTPDIIEQFTTFWDIYKNNPLEGRNIILKSFCPQLYGLNLVKLAVAVVLAGGSQFQNSKDTGVRIRTEPHLLLVGDPGTGKSQLLKFASKIIPRSVLTTGVGSTSAGLTVAAIMEGGEWQLEGGALVLSDGGICCIDEFNSMKEHDRTSIHEAMEQQTISVAKAGIVCKLNTRCSILAATNFKGQLQRTHSLNMSIALATPLLSRFDLILILKDKIDSDWDNLLCSYLLNGHKFPNSKSTVWSIEQLQAYFSIIRKKNPILTKSANRILSAYYQMQRKSITRDKARTTVRLLDSMIRLAEAHAKLMFREEVLVMDAIMVVILIEASMQENTIIGIEFDIHSLFANNITESYLELLQIILTKLNLLDILESENYFLNNLTNNSQKPSTSTSFNQFPKNLIHQRTSSNLLDNSGHSVDTTVVKTSFNNEFNTNNIQTEQLSNDFKKWDLCTKVELVQPEKNRETNTLNQLTNNYKKEDNERKSATKTHHRKRKKSENDCNNETEAKRKNHRKKSNENGIANDFKMFQLIPSAADTFDVDLNDDQEDGNALIADDTSLDATATVMNNWSEGKQKEVFSSRFKEVAPTTTISELDLIENSEVVIKETNESWSGNLKKEQSSKINSSTNKPDALLKAEMQKNKIKNLMATFNFKPRNKRSECDKKVLDTSTEEKIATFSTDENPVSSSFEEKVSSSDVKESPVSTGTKVKAQVVAELSQNYLGNEEIATCSYRQESNIFESQDEEYDCLDFD